MILNWAHPQKLKGKGSILIAGPPSSPMNLQFSLDTAANDQGLIQGGWMGWLATPPPPPHSPHPFYSKYVLFLNNKNQLKFCC